MAVDDYIEGVVSPFVGNDRESSRETLSKRLRSSHDALPLESRQNNLRPLQLAAGYWLRKIRAARFYRPTDLVDFHPEGMLFGSVRSIDVNNVGNREKRQLPNTLPAHVRPALVGRAVPLFSPLVIPDIKKPLVDLGAIHSAPVVSDRDGFRCQVNGYLGSLCIPRIGYGLG